MNGGELVSVERSRKRVSESVERNVSAMVNKAGLRRVEMKGRNTSKWWVGVVVVLSAGWE